MDERQAVNEAYAAARNMTATAYKDFLTAAHALAEKLAAYTAAKKEETRLERILRDALGQPKQYEGYDG